MREPTPQECSDRAEVRLNDQLVGRACWYPQMGGYVGAAVAVVDAGCVDVYVWHDGSFPFGAVDGWGEERGPVRLHHCNGEQFVDFGNFMLSLQGRS